MSEPSSDLINDMRDNTSVEGGKARRSRSKSSKKSKSKSRPKSRSGKKSKKSHKKK